MHLILFPSMHPELVPADLPREVRILNPGIMAEQPSNLGFWRPDDLPLDHRQAARFLSESLGFGERFQKPSDLNYFASAGLEDYYSGTSLSIQSEFKRAAGLSGGAEPNGHGAKQRRLQAQMSLLLAWRFEESLVEYRQLRQGVSQTWRQLQQTIGLEGDSAPFAGGPGMQEPHEANSSSSLPWPRLLPWFLVFLHPDDGLAVVDQTVMSEWEEAGLSGQPLSREDCEAFGLDVSFLESFQVQVIRAPGWRLALKDADDEDMPWLQEDRTAVCIRPL
jgi:hypothetical protein